MQQNNYLLFLFPICKNKWTTIDKIIKSDNIKIIDKKLLYLTDIGKFNLIKNIYKNEDWLGTIDNNYDGLYYKLNSCFRHDDNSIIIYFIKTDLNTIIKVKNEVRNLCKIGNHSVHTTDTNEEYNTLSKYYNNINTIKYLNTIKEMNFSNFNTLFNKLKQYIKSNNINVNNICISGSSVLSAFNLRDCYDIDFLSIDNIKDFEPKIGSYNNHYLSSNFYKEQKIEISQIINNDQYFFYYEGLKFMSLELIKTFKNLRNEEKDKHDILLIERILNDENYRC